MWKQCPALHIEGQTSPNTFLVNGNSTNKEQRTQTYHIKKEDKKSISVRFRTKNICPNTGRGIHFTVEQSQNLSSLNPHFQKFGWHFAFVTFCPLRIEQKCYFVNTSSVLCNTAQTTLMNGCDFFFKSEVLVSTSCLLSSLSPPSPHPLAARCCPPSILPSILGVTSQPVYLYE